MAAHITPTFLLKGLDYKRLLADYNSGFFSRVPIKKEKIKSSKTNLVLAQEYGTSNYDPMFSVKDKYNGNVVVATIGNTDFEIFTKSGGKLSTGGRCDFCKEDIIGTPIGIPVGYQESTILTEDGGNYYYRVTYTFWVERRNCDFECALAYAKRDSSLRDSERLLKMMHRFMHPKEKTLVPAQDPGLLLSNGGPLTKEQWKEEKHEYIRTDRVLVIPAKSEYIRNEYQG